MPPSIRHVCVRVASWDHLINELARSPGLRARLPSIRAAPAMWLDENQHDSHSSGEPLTDSLRVYTDVVAACDKAEPGDSQEDTDEVVFCISAVIHDRIRQGETASYEERNRFPFFSEDNNPLYSAKAVEHDGRGSDSSDPPPDATSDWSSVGGLAPETAAGGSPHTESGE